jgi:uncharacterized membrane-anchored protein
VDKRVALAIFAAAVAVQVLILVAIPFQKVLTRTTGRTMVLKVVPVDPYNMLSGYYVVLGYEISRPESFPNRPEPLGGGTLYAVVEASPDGLWHPVSLERSLPANLPVNRVAIRGNMEGWRMVYGIEEYYIPEANRSVVANDLRQHLDKARVEVKVDAEGNAALVRLWIENRVYE